MEEINKVLEILMRRHKCKRKKATERLATELGRSVNTIQGWLSGRKVPNTTVMYLNTKYRL